MAWSESTKLCSQGEDPGDIYLSRRLERKEKGLVLCMEELTVLAWGKRYKQCQACSWATQLQSKCHHTGFSFRHLRGSPDSHLWPHHCTTAAFGVCRFRLGNVDLLLPWDIALGFHNKDRLKEHQQKNFPILLPHFMLQERPNIVSVMLLLDADDWAKDSEPHIMGVLSVRCGTQFLPRISAPGEPTFVLGFPSCSP